MSTDDRTCPSCGARVPDGAARCDLCGTTLESADPPDDPEEDPADEGDAASTHAPSEEVSPKAEPSEEGGSDEASGVFCNQCGWENPAGARYCSQCGEELQDLSSASPEGTRRVAADLPSGGPGASTSSGEEDESEGDVQGAMGQQIALVVGGALVLVLGLFFVTQWSAQQEWGDGGGSEAAPTDAGGGPAAQSSGGQPPMASSGGGGGPAPMDLQALLDQTADSLTGPMVQQIDSLRARVEQASGTSKRQLQAELVNLLIGAGHPGRAALVQKELADATGAVDAQRRAADLLYRWMQKVQGQGQREQVFQVARHAAQAYEKVSEQRPGDLDARTRMGEAYLLTNEPMRGIQSINAVLEEDSTFVPARFQKGLALLQINRLDQARQQFEMVREYAEEGSPFAQQADRAITVIEEQRTGGASGASSSAPQTGS